jgi:superfamily I DNA/RNA helicase
MENVELILGPPGTGKTTSLLTIVDEVLKQGLPPWSIGYLSFTKRAVEEAAERAAVKFKLKRKQFTFFKTIHSMAFYQLGLNVNLVMQREHYRNLGKQIGVPITGVQRQDLATYEMSLGDQIIFIESLSRLKCEDLRTTWESQDSDVTWLELNYVVDALKKYKQVNMMLDYADMLVKFHNQGEIPRLQMLIVDEAQDLCLLQWKIIERSIEKIPRVVIAGDDDQAIFRWSGAAVDYFTGLTKRIKRPRILSQSYRLPSTVKKLSDDLITRIRDRAMKPFKSTEDTGSVERIRAIEDLDLSTGNWLILLRNNYQMKDVLEYLQYAGYVYRSAYGDVRDQPGVKASLAWETLRGGRKIGKTELYYINKFRSRPVPTNYENMDPKKKQLPWYEALDLLPITEREYYRACRHRGESFITEPRIVVTTIHGSKGSECENVVVSTDMSLRSYENYLKHQDDEIRVYYVACTRARKNLYLLQPKTNQYFQI